ncbi:F-box/FBD/LRR-repeat protein At3g52680-like [Lycium barbarum]|uniref:F-box/FBD/LRR-repeat protein At3g52680-like n=1 Tax=Lycium barbarum TaxID=112863 RepID=UPI00293E3287|nr:F-box/FBD/LRR-repeat protein At3g52680-like [Lycium barbarum]
MAEIVDGKDRITELPEHIIHHVIRRVSQRNVKEAARTCVLSRTWNRLWTLRPDLMIDQGSHNSFRSLEKFVKFVDDSIEPYVKEKISIDSFRLCQLLHPELASHLDRWINVAIEHNIRDLEISTSFYPLYYNVPDTIYTAKKLTKLWLRRCDFEIHNSASNNKLQRLISTCPFIKDLRLHRCRGIHNLHVFGLENLENLELWGCDGLEKLEVKAPNLRKFVYVGVPLYRNQKKREVELLPCKIEILDGYKTLKTLKLEATTMTDQQFEHQFSKFSALNELELRRCYTMKNIVISSEKLSKFSLSHWMNLEQVKMLAPNLMEFNFLGYKMPFSTMDPSSLVEAELNFYLQISPSKTYFGDVDKSWYDNLQDFVQKFNYAKGLILIIHCEEVLHQNVTGKRDEQNGGSNQVRNYKGATAKEGASNLYGWLESTSLIEKITTFMFKSEENALSD